MRIYKQPVFQVLKRESERHAEGIWTGVSWQLRWLNRWYERNVMDFSGYEIVDIPLAMDEGVATTCEHRNL